MTPTNFTDDVVILGSQDIAQLQVRANGTQTQPLQNWQDSSSNVLVQVTSDGKFQLGDPGLLGTPTALIEANETIVLPSTKPQRGFHSIGKFSGAVTSALTWIYNELRLLGTGGVSGLHIAHRSQLTLDVSSTAAANAELRAGDFLTSNAAGTGGSLVGQATGSRSTASNAAGAYLNKAVGVEGAISNDTGGNITTAAMFSGVIPANNGSIGTLYGLQLPDLNQAAINYALYMGQGIAHFGDVLELPVLGSTPSANPAPNFVKFYVKLNGSNPQLYAKNNSGSEVALGAGSVTSVGLSLPPMFSVSGSPVTASGTLNAALVNQNARLVFAGPTSGNAAAAPTFRNIDMGDFANQGANVVLAGPSSGGAAAPTWRSLVSLDVPVPLTLTALSDVIPLTLKAVSGQTVDVFNVLTSGSDKLLRISQTSNLLQSIATSGSGILNALTINNLSAISGGGGGVTPAAGYGVGLQLAADDATVKTVNISRWRASWTTAADASRASQGFLSVNDSTGERDVLKLVANGSRGTVSALAGTSTSYATIGGTIFDHASSSTVPNNSSTETDLYSDSVPGNTFATNGDTIHIVYSGTMVNNSNAKNARVYVGGTKVFDIALPVNTAGSWIIEFRVIRLSSTILNVTGYVASGSTFITNVTNVTGLTLSNAQIIKLTGQSTVSAQMAAVVGKLIYHPAA